MWLISAPTWGDQHLGVFERIIPTIRLAAQGVKDQSLLVVHTDQPIRVKQFSDRDLRILARPLPDREPKLENLTFGHREVLESAAAGDVVVLTCADVVLSVEALSVCEEFFRAGKKLVCINAVRAIFEDYDLIPRRGRALSEWGWKHRHPLTRDMAWPGGRTDGLQRVYWERDGNVVCRLWMPHPLALKIDGRPLNFNPTVDCDLVSCYQPEEIAFVTDPDVFSAVELSLSARSIGHDPDDATLPTIAESYVSKRTAWMMNHRSIYRWFLEQRVVVVGQSVDCGDEGPVAELLALRP
jgi:hypothetical protein